MSFEFLYIHHNHPYLVALDRQLRTIDTFLNVRIWVLDSSGVVIADTRSNAVNLDINSLDETFLEKTFIENAYFKGTKTHDP